MNAHYYNTDGPPWVCSCGWVFARKGVPILSEKPPRNCPRETQGETRANTSIANGPGTELKRLLHKFGIVATGVCKCNQRAMVMDEEGPDWCRENIDVIIGWLKEEADNRGMVFSSIGVRLLVRYAIRSAEKKQRMMING